MIPASGLLETPWPGPPSLLQHRPPGGTPRPAPEHRVYPYLLEKIRVTRPNQAWAADITYLPMARRLLDLVTIVDWHSRYVVSWRLSNTLEADFCVEALKEALGQGQPGSSTPTRAASSPAGGSSMCCRTTR